MSGATSAGESGRGEARDSATTSAGRGGRGEARDSATTSTGRSGRGAGSRFGYFRRREPGQSLTRRSVAKPRVQQAHFRPTKWTSNSLQQRRPSAGTTFSGDDFQRRRPSAGTTLRGSHRHLPTPAPQRTRGQPPNPASDNADDLVKPLHGSARYARRGRGFTKSYARARPTPHRRQGASAASGSEMSHEQRCPMGRQRSLHPYPTTRYFPQPKCLRSRGSEHALPHHYHQFQLPHPKPDSP